RNKVASGCPPPVTLPPASSSAPHFACGCTAASFPLLAICCASLFLRPRKIGQKAPKTVGPGSPVPFAVQFGSHASTGARTRADFAPRRRQKYKPRGLNIDPRGSRPDFFV